MHELGRRGQHRESAEPAKLMDAAVASNYDAILNGHVAGNHRAIAHHDMISDQAIVRDVTRPERTLSEPIRVKSPSFVAQWTVTYSRNTLRSPIRRPGL